MSSGWMPVVAIPLLVLQHIGCEPPAAYEDELRAWDIQLVRVQHGDTYDLPEAAGQLARSEAQ